MDGNNCHVLDDLNAKIISTRNECAIDWQSLEVGFKDKMKELSDSAKDIKVLTKEKQELDKDLASFESGISKMQDFIEKAEQKCEKCEENNEIKGKKLESNKENVEIVLNMWSTIGLRARKSDNTLILKFNKIVDKQPNKEFVVNVAIDGNTFKFLESDFNFDYSDIEEKMANRKPIENNKKLDTRCLIALIRHNLVKQFN